MALFPTNNKSTLSRHQNGKFHTNRQDMELHTILFCRRPMLATLQQRHPKTSLHLFNHGDTKFRTPQQGHDRQWGKGVHAHFTINYRSHETYLHVQNIS
jgi:hypothetical protein